MAGILAGVSIQMDSSVNHFIHGCDDVFDNYMILNLNIDILGYLWVFKRGEKDGVAKDGIDFKGGAVWAGSVVHIHGY